MFFLLRMAFWLGVVLVLLPSGGSAERGQSAGGVGAADALSAASATVNDFKGFCAREPDACTVGSEVATTIGYRAQAGAKMLYDFLTQALAPREPASVIDGRGQHRSAGGGVPGKAAAQATSQNTLAPGDLNPAWRGPPARKDAKPSA